MLNNRGCYVNGTATIISDEETFIFTNVSKDCFKELMNLTRAELHSKVMSKLSDSVKDNMRTKSSLEDFVIKNANVFYLDKGLLYLREIPLPIPPELKDTFINANKEELEALKNFWCWTALNPNPESRQDLYTFVKHNGIQITPNGNLVLYRSIVKRSDADSSLIDFVSSQWTKIRKWKKSPSNFYVYRDRLDPTQFLLKPVLAGTVEGVFDYAGNLQELYENLPNMSENDYTDGHTKKMNIKIGQVYKIDESGVSTDNRVSCDRGLHVASKSYDYGSFGDTKVVVLVNPSKVRAVPLGEAQKMRVSEMFILCKQTDLDDDLLLEYDNKYFDANMEELVSEIKGANIQDVKGADRKLFDALFINNDALKKAYEKAIEYAINSRKEIVEPPIKEEPKKTYEQLKKEQQEKYEQDLEDALNGIIEMLANL